MPIFLRSSRENRFEGSTLATSCIDFFSNLIKNLSIYRESLRQIGVIGGEMGEPCCQEEKRSTPGAGPFFGRFLISLIFILAGIGKIVDFQGAADALRSVGIQGANAYTFIGLLMELIGGVLLLLGWRTKLAIYLLMIFLLPTTLIFHGFWNYQGAEMALQFQIFLKNLTIYGGLLVLLSFGPGRWSVDEARRLTT